MSPALVFIVDDDAAVRDSLSLLCETAGLEAECHDSAESFLAAYRPEQAGCLVLDVRMGRMSGPELHAELNRRGSHLPIIYLTAHGDIPMTVRAMQAGAVDFLTKPVDGAAFLDRVQAALRHSRDLRDRQQALAGHPNKTIAKRLGISYRTVEIHRSRILHKTGTASLLELAQLAADCGLTLENTPQSRSPEERSESGI